MKYAEGDIVLTKTERTVYIVSVYLENYIVCDTENNKTYLITDEDIIMNVMSS